jgi:ubiquinone/menaquinone biosynthesis C-methylase UbiE/DNA-binding transcriptional ArsR family regulator
MEMGTLFKALADDTRLRIMLLLQVMELSVGELALILDQSQPRVSRHVRILVEAGLAERHKEGSWVFLRPALSRAAIAQTAHAEAADLLHRFLCQQSIVGEPLASQSANDQSKLTEIRSQRDERAAQYFAQHAANWDKMRSLYIAEQEIEDALIALLPDDSIGRLLDIGTGTGRMVELLASRASHSTAIDKSPEMLRFARSKLQHLPPDRLELVQGDFNHLPLQTNGFDTIVLHQVLHFAQNPEQVIIEAARVAAPGGQIVIVDFAPHLREELRESDAHARLGFADDQMRDFFNVSGFTFDDVVTLAGGTLTVKIWTGRYQENAPHPLEQANGANDKVRMIVKTPSNTARKAVA